MALGSTQPVTEMSTKNILGGKGQPARRADNPAVFYEPIIYEMWEPEHLTTLWASTACYRDTLTFFTKGISTRKSQRHQGFLAV
jgi:hypothetical protein